MKRTSWLASTPSKRGRTGRKVYYRTWSASSTQHFPKQQMLAELHAHTRQQSDASRRAREMEDQHKAERMFRCLGIDYTSYEQKQFDNVDRRLLVEQKLNKLIAFEDIERFVIVLKTLKRIRLLFHNKDKTKWWFIERNLLNNTMRRSIDYDYHALAWHYHVCDRIHFI